MVLAGPGAGLGAPGGCLPPRDVLWHGDRVPSAEGKSLGCQSRGNPDSGHSADHRRVSPAPESAQSNFSKASKLVRGHCGIKARRVPLHSRV